MTTIQQSGSARWSWDSDGVVTVTLDDPGRTANMLNQRHFDGLDACLDDLTEHLDRLRGVVLTSAKRSFIAGPDFEPSEITPDEAAGTYELLVPLRDQARRLETLGRPVAAALNGSALGGGFELALACHYRVGPTDPAVVWALAETGMGILPAGGGTVRVTRMFGIAATVLDIVGPGTVYHPEQALAAGLVDELADDVVTTARTWVLAKPPGHFTQRWDRPGYRIPGGTTVPSGLADEVNRRSQGSPVRVLATVLDVAARSAAAPLHEAFTIETEACLALLAAPEFPALARFFYALRSTATIPKSLAPVRSSPGTRTFPQIVANPLAAVFFTPDARIVEITDETLIPAIRASGDIPVLINSGQPSFIQTLLDAGSSPSAMAEAAHRAVTGGLRIDQPTAGVAAVLAAGYPAWADSVIG
ncbi:enoyl-CoA hydratase/isomerase family protein [Actinoplanes derwentensis]|uniref:3-hydroxyacyl-CoA dehydrogenase / enoyl-CoA hydratase / 3-hydroxybutyryl-CoA epimerase n=1 Tax=Actinoplanes derwentensis TaxID=113562 RepID=A0A1H1SBM3_9ACTN|nr:enoyl-CoA hydratase/isomerase family protein [Actinoplanes derwentensis]SDS45384.1 3-hydroxyacyl-CoA dehydrogenase / enoyl-CoA hydratase / 3-hydroxybutyryl-CoA epimerase [Actinoplanes derwentensis]